MYADRKAQALGRWHSILSNPQIRMTAQEQYAELLSLADEYFAQGFIESEEHTALLNEAAQRYAQAIEGVGQGT